MNFANEDAASVAAWKKEKGEKGTYVFFLRVSAGEQNVFFLRVAGEDILFERH